MGLFPRFGAVNANDTLWLAVHQRLLGSVAARRDGTNFPRSCIPLDFWGDPPELGMVTFVDTDKVRKKRDWGRCYLKAGFKNVGFTKGGLVALLIEPSGFPLPQAPVNHFEQLTFV